MVFGVVGNALLLYMAGVLMDANAMDGVSVVVKVFRVLCKVLPCGC